MKNARRNATRAAIRGADLVRRTFTSVLVVAIAMILAGLLPQAARAQSEPASPSLIVKLVAGLSVDDQAAVIARNGGIETSAIPALRLHVVAVDAARVDQIADGYRADPQVVRVEVNNLRQSNAVPSDPLYPQQWALPKIGWDLVFGNATPNASVVVAVLDTGIDATHPDLFGNVIAGTSILDGSNGLTDPSGHGTMVAGTVAARTDTTPPEGMAGIAYAGVRLMPVTVLDADGLGQDSDIIAGVVWAVEHGANVILMAFSNPGFSESLQEAIDYAWSSNVVLVAAAGNEGLNAPTYPAGDRGVIGVSATDENDRLAAFSNSGPSVFLAAPGTDVLTTDAGGTYIAINGTSSSAAIVAGAAAQMMAIDPTLANGIIVGRLARSADPAGTQDETGNGRLNLARALVDTGIDFVQPAGAAPVGGGGPFVGPYQAAACTLSTVSPVIAQSPVSATPGDTVTYANIALNKSNNGNCSGNWTINWIGGSAPAGITATFTPSTFSGSGTTKTTTLTITTSSPATPVGTRNFTVTAGGSDTAGSVTSSNFTFTLIAPTTTIGAVSGSGTFGGTATLTATLTSGGSPLSGKSITFQLNGNPAGSATTNATGVATVSGVSLSGINAGGYPGAVSASFAGDAGYQASSGSGALTVAMTSSTTAVSCPANAAYTGAAQTPCTATVTGAGLSQSLPVNYASNIDAGTATASASFAGDGNHTGSSDSKTFTINQAGSTTTVSCPASVTYTGAAQTPCTASVTGAGGLSLTPLPTYSNNINVGTATASASFAGDGNHTGSSDSKTFAIDKASTTTSVTSSPNPSTADDSVTFTATVTSVAAAAGSVQFVVDGNSFGAVAVVGGQASLTTSALKTAKTYAVSAIYSGDDNLQSSTGILTGGQVVTAGEPTQLVFGVQPTGAQAGHALSPAVTVQVLDAAGNLTTSAASVTMTANGPGPFSGTSTTTVAAISGVAMFSDLHLNTAGSYTIAAASGTLNGATSNTFQVAPGAAVTFALAVPASITAGQSFDITVTAKDQFDNTATGYTGVVHFASSDAQATLPGDEAFGAGDNGVRSIAIGTVLKTSGSQTITATDTVATTPTISGTSPTIIVNPGNATVLVVTAPAAVETAAVAFDVTVEARDAFGNTATGYVGPTHFDSTDPKADMPADYTFEPGIDRGIHTFSVTLHTAGQFTVKATDVESSFYGVSGTITVQPGPPAKLAFKTQPAYTVVGVAIADFAVEVQDADDNLVDSSNAAITIAIGTNPTGVAVLGGTATQTAVGGVATFGGLTLNKAAVAYTLLASSGTLAGATSDPFDVGKGAATLSVGNLSHTYDGSAKSALVTTSPVGLTGVSVTYDGSSVPPTNAGSYAVIASLDNPDYEASNAIGTLVIDKAGSATTLTCPASVTYNGTAQTPCSAIVTGAGGLNQALTVSYTDNTNAGTATASAAFAGDPNHTGSSDTKTFAIAKAASTTTLSCPASVTYNGGAQAPCAASVSGAGGLNQSLIVVYGNNMNAGAASASAVFAGDANHNGSSDARSFTIAKAASTTTLTCPASVTYDGGAQTPCSANVTGAGGLNQSLTVIYGNNVNAGTATASAGYAGDGNHNDSSDSKTYVIDKASSTTTVTVANAFYDGSPHAGAAIVTGAGALNQTLGVTYSGIGGTTYGPSDTPPTEVGVYQAAAAFGGDANHAGSGDARTFNIVGVSVEGSTEPIAKGGPATLSVTLVGAISAYPVACTIDWTDGMSGDCAAPHTYAAAGVYEPKVTVTSAAVLGTGAGTWQYVVVYDATNGFVTGGGWINSPQGAYVANTNLLGKANFGFVSKYQKGANVPSGNTEFQFQAAGFNFKSTVYEWLVIAGPKAQYKGSGTLNGTGDYGFMLTAIDGAINGGGGTDKFRLKVWDKASGTTIYDNQSGAPDTSDPTTLLGGGSIVIHK